MTAPASTKYKVSKKVVKRYLADHDLTQKQLAQMAGITPGALSASSDSSVTCAWVIFSRLPTRCGWTRATSWRRWTNDYR